MAKRVDLGLVVSVEVILEDDRVAARTVEFGPNGPDYGSLCDIPELRDHFRYYDLSKGRGGELSPYLVAEPREGYPDSRSERASQAVEVLAKLAEASTSDDD